MEREESFGTTWDKEAWDQTAWDVVILGGGLAGLTLARHLLLDTDKRVLVVERQAELPQKKQKVGESTVQLAGYYLSKVLDLEEHLLHEHFMKYNLRFYWRTADPGTDFEDYSAASIRPFSNIPSYQVDRNRFEGELQRLCREDGGRFHLVTGARELDVELAADGDGKAPHRVSFSLNGTPYAVGTDWLVDSTGRGRFLAKQKKFLRPAPIRHGALAWWVDGLVDIERLSDLDRTARRRHPRRRRDGHLPHWLATNHFCDHGLWFWVIPLRGKTSLGVVFDHAEVDWNEVSDVEKATEFVCERFPLFARDLPNRTVTDVAVYRNYAHDCVQTLSASRWAMSGVSGRFSDPLYSPGSDLIAMHNTLIVHAIGLDDVDERRQFCQLSESLQKAMFHAYVPGYVDTYDCLGDEEAFTVKYVWELTIYFAFYVFPFINDLFTDRRFVVGFLRQFSRLGAWNRGILQLLAGYTTWKREHREPLGEPVSVDFMDVDSLKRAEKTFYEVDATATEGKRVLREQMENLEELARFFAVHIAAEVIGEPEAKTDAAFIRTFDLENLSFEPDAWAARYAETRGGADESWAWNLDPQVFDRFRTAAVARSEALEAVVERTEGAADLAGAPR
ncbi:MAG: hypothetical protein AAGM22_04575 [Acidobacteriota bacterium]